MRSTYRRILASSHQIYFYFTSSYVNWRLKKKKKVKLVFIWCGWKLLGSHGNHDVYVCHRAWNKRLLNGPAVTPFWRWFSLALQFKRLCIDFTKIKFSLEHWGGLKLIPQVRNLSWMFLWSIILFIEAMTMSFHPGKRVFWGPFYGWALLHLSLLRQIGLYISDSERKRKFTRKMNKSNNC